MITKNFFGLAKGLVFTPSTTFHKVKEIKNTTPYLIYVVVYYLIYGLLNYLLIPDFGSQQVITRPSSTTLAFRQFLDNLTALNHTYSVVIGVFGWLFFSSFFYFSARLFSKRGRFTSFLIAEGLISLIIGPVDLLLLTARQQLGLSSLNLLILIMGLWASYLSIVAMSVIFEISKKKALLIRVISLILFIVLFMVYMFLSVANILSTY